MNQAVQYFQFPMSIRQIKRAIYEINNDVYFEKLGSMLAKLRAWLTNKNINFNACYIATLDLVLEESTKRHGKISVYYQKFWSLLQEINDSFQKINSTSNVKKSFLQHCKSPTPKDNQTTKTLENLERVREIWTSRRQGIRKIQNFARIIGLSINERLDENNMNFQQLKSQAKKFQKSIKDPGSEYLKKFELNIVKKNKKQYEISRIKEAREMFNSEVNEVEKGYIKFMDTYTKFIGNHCQFAQSFYRNIIILNQILNDCFPGFGNTIAEEAEKFLENLKAENGQIYSKIQDQDRRKTIAIGQLKQKLDEIKCDTLKDIEVASWVMLGKKKQEEDFNFKKGILTIDNKLLVVEEKTKEIEAQIDLVQSISCESGAKGEMVISLKKKKSQSVNMKIKFEKPENEDEFKLHLERVKGQIQ